MRLPRVRLTVGRSMLLVALGGLALGGYARWVQPGRDQARCQANLRAIGLALNAYQAAHGSLPPAFVVDAGGRAIHSWRALILPYLDEPALARAYRFDEPWDGPHNARLMEQVPAVYQCPRHPIAGCSCFAAIIGPQTAWPGTSAVSLAAIQGSDTLLAVELADGIPWLEPRDLIDHPTNPAAPKKLSSGDLIRDRNEVDDAQDELLDLYRQGMARPGQQHEGVNVLMPFLRVVSFRRMDTYGFGMHFRCYLTTLYDWDEEKWY